MRHRPAFCLLTTILALVTALALLSTGLTIGAPRVADPRPAATEQVARTFYAAVNETIRTGDSAALDAAVSPQLMTGGALAALAPGRAGLVRYLASLHATHPQLELSVEHVVAAGDQALVQLAVRGAEEASFLGSPARGGPPPWGTVDAVTVAGGRVVAFEGGTTGMVLREPLGQMPFTIDAFSKRLIALDRLLIPPGATFAARGAEESRLLFVEAGPVTVTSTPLTIPQPIHQAPSEETMEPTGDEEWPDPWVLTGIRARTPHPLTVGDVLSPPTWSRTDVHNVGTEPASVLVLATGTSEMLGGWTSTAAGLDAQPPAAAGTGLIGWQAGVAQESPSGAIVTPLTGIAITTLPGTQAAAALGRVTLAPGAMLSAPEVTGPQLLVVEAGTLDLVTGGHPAWVYRGEGSALQAGTLGVGAGAVLHAGTAALLQNTGRESVVFAMIAIHSGDVATSGS